MQKNMEYCKQELLLSIIFIYRGAKEEMVLHREAKKEGGCSLDVALKSSLGLGGGTISLHGAVVGQVADLLLNHSLKFASSSMELSIGIVDFLLSLSVGLLSGTLASETWKTECLTDGLLGTSDNRVGAVVGGALELFGLSPGVGNLLGGLGFGFLAGTVCSHVGVSHCLADGLLCSADVLVGGVGESFGHFFL